ncbi:hypothetical protein C4D60_Mb02t09820 [Musa balbisiana]|uniref:Uncharacterized protein n=1 Tax=Musa balbisiana TaxID=52838 RepID=A0A4S8I9R2_MUSBA|nr:hypothetical protein C4D60_Mb02t09820 [Musa balbisiana]
MTLRRKNARRKDPSTLASSWDCYSIRLRGLADARGVGSWPGHDQSPWICLFFPEKMIGLEDMQKESSMVN